MPTFDASISAIMAALADRYGAPVAAGSVEGRDPFSALVAVLIGRAADPGKGIRALDALADAGLLDPRTLAEVDVPEIVDTLKSSGIGVPARGLASIPRLAR